MKKSPALAELFPGESLYLLSYSPPRWNRPVPPRHLRAKKRVRPGTDQVKRRTKYNGCRHGRDVATRSPTYLKPYLTLLADLRTVLTI